MPQSKKDQQKVATLEKTTFLYRSNTLICLWTIPLKILTLQFTQQPLMIKNKPPISDDNLCCYVKNTFYVVQDGEIRVNYKNAYEVSEDNFCCYAKIHITSKDFQGGEIGVNDLERVLKIAYEVICQKDHGIHRRRIELEVRQRSSHLFGGPNPCLAIAVLSLKRLNSASLFGTHG